MCRMVTYSPLPPPLHPSSPTTTTTPSYRTAAYPVQDGRNGVEELVFLKVFKTGHHD